MGHSQAEKASNRDRILDAAASQIREGGLDSVSVGKLMASVGLTHGGFYNHFASRSELVVEALQRALESSAGSARTAAGRSSEAHGFEKFVRSYLSRPHRDNRKSGCAIAALLSDVGRSDEQLRALMEEYVEAYIANMATRLGGVDEEQAIFAASAMIGALALSRVYADTNRSDALLRAVRRQLDAFNPDQAAAPPT